MKIGVYLGDYIPTSGGGFTFEQEIISALADISDESQHQFVMFTKSTEIKADARNIRIHPLKSVPSTFSIPETFGKAKAALKWLRHPGIPMRYISYNERIVLTSGVQIVWNLTPFTITQEIPYILPIWDLQHRLQPYFDEVNLFPTWHDRERFYSDTIRRASFILTGTQRGKDEIQMFYNVAPERIKIIPFPTPSFEDTSQPTDHSEFERLSLPPNYLFYPAQFWPHKNHVNLLDALRILRDEHQTKIPLVLVGSDKGNQSYIQQYIDEWDLKDQVQILGFVSKNVLRSLYQNAFALVFPTFFGPDNLPPLEAFALGCPVIASDVPGAQEQLGNAALRVDPKKAEEIAMAILSLVNSPALRQELILKGIERAKCWTGKDYVRSIFALLDEFEFVRRCWP